MTGGLVALIGITILGPRDGVSFRHGRVHAPLAQSDTFRTLGTMALWFGWLGLNGCSMGKLIDYSGVAARAVMMTIASATTSGLVGTVVSTGMASADKSQRVNIVKRCGQQRSSRVGTSFQVPSPSLAVSGGTGSGPQIGLTPMLHSIIAGLVGIAASCGLVDLFGALAIGIGSALSYISASRIVERLGVDDVRQAVSVHFAAGAWGVVSVGLFTTKDAYAAAFGPGCAEQCAGLFYGGDGRQLGASLVFVLALISWTAAASGFLFFLFHHNGVLRIPRLVAMAGMDQFIHNDAVDREVEENAMERTMGGWSETMSRRDSFESKNSAASLGSAVVSLGSAPPPSWHGAQDSKRALSFVSLDLESLGRLQSSNLNVTASLEKSNPSSERNVVPSLPALPQSPKTSSVGSSQGQKLTLLEDIDEEMREAVAYQNSAQQMKTVVQVVPDSIEDEEAGHVEMKVDLDF